MTARRSSFPTNEGSPFKGKLSFPTEKLAMRDSFVGRIRFFPNERRESLQGKACSARFAIGLNVTLGHVLFNNYLNLGVSHLTSIISR